MEQLDDLKTIIGGLPPSVVAEIDLGVAAYRGAQLRAAWKKHNKKISVTNPAKERRQHFSRSHDLQCEIARRRISGESYDDIALDFGCKAGTIREWMFRFTWAARLLREVTEPSPWSGLSPTQQLKLAVQRWDEKSHGFAPRMERAA